MIQVHPRAYDLAKFGERPAAFRLTGPVRRQIARHDVWSTRNQRAEVPASAEVSRLIHDSRLIEVGVAPRAAEADELAILAGQIERDRSDFESDTDAPIAAIIRFSVSYQSN